VSADDFLSGESGHVAGIRAVAKHSLRDAYLDLRLALGRAGRAARRATGPRRRVLVAGIYGGAGDRIARTVDELRRTHHDADFVLGGRAGAAHGLDAVTAATGLPGGKFENLNALLADRDPAAYDWFLVIDDDVLVPRGFLDRFIAICEALDFGLAQPAQTWRSHAAWQITRRRGGVVARETGFVEVGPLTAFRGDVAAELYPFPQLRYGWGLDVHWAALAEQRGWRLGIVDALPVRHDLNPVATSYSHEGAVREAREFLRDRPYVPADRAQRTIAVHSKLTR
jgi:hypothetical protein